MASTQAAAYRRVYVWQLPVRLFHWVNAFCVATLCVTGYIIGNPAAVFHSAEAYQQYWFGIIRFIHFGAAYLFLWNGLGRVYWSFAGNRYARWRNYVPYNLKSLKRLFETIKVDITHIKLKGPIPIGHNMLAGTSYFILFLLFLFQVVTGFALYAGNSSWFFPKLFTWVTPLMGGEIYVRQWHHLAMWGFVVFLIVHVYLVFYHDVIEGRGTTTAIINGWKFVREDIDGKK